MKLYQYITIISSFGLASATYAGLFPNQWEDSNKGILQASIEGQYYYQSNNLVTANQTLPGIDEGITLLRAPGADKEWGYRALLGYIFPLHHYDIRASYWDVSADNNFNSSQSFSDSIIEISQKNNYDFKAAEITIGQYFSPTCCLSLRVGYGIVYADIKQKSKATEEAFSAGHLENSGQDLFENSFKGIGPKLGLDAAFDINNAFSLLGGVGTSVLFGKSEADYKTLTQGDEAATIKKESNKAVFEIDAKLGAGYTKVLNNDFALAIEAGYRGAYYFDALQKTEIQVSIEDIMLNANNDNNDYYNYGPYVSVMVNFM